MTWLPPGAFSVLIQCWGLLWDLSWHQQFGRDSFLDPPHVVMALGMVVAVGALVHEWRRPRPPGTHRLAGPGVLLVGIVWEIGALGMDQLWHELFGPDLAAGIWSPPHVMVITGVWLQAVWAIAAGLPRPIHSLLGCAVLVSVVSPFFGPIEWMLHRSDPFVHPLLMTLLGAGVLMAGRTATEHRYGCTITAALYTVIRGAPSLILGLAGRTIPGFPTPLLVPALLSDCWLGRATTPTRGAVLRAGTAYGVLPLFEWPLVNLGTAYHWPIDVALYQWPIEVALFAVVPAALAGACSSALGWRLGRALRSGSPR